MVNLVKKVIQQQAEKKEVAVANMSGTLNATQSYLNLLSGVAQGTTHLTRVGDEIRHCYLEINLFIYNTGTDATVGYGDCGFWAIVLDRGIQGTAPIFTNIFDDSIGGQQGLDFRSTTNGLEDRFKIIRREEWCIGETQTGGSIGVNPGYHIKEFIDLSNLGDDDGVQKFNSGSTASSTAIGANAIYFVIASARSSAQNVTTVVGQAKYRFTDV